MSAKRRSRRSFLVESFTGLNAAWVAANYPGILAAQNYVRKATDAGQLPRLAVFSEAQATEIEAMTAQIIPTDETPGAREAHCVYFIDRALVDVLEGQATGLRTRAAGASSEDAAALPGREQILGAHFRAADQDAHRDRKDAVLRTWSARTPSSDSSLARCTAATTTKIGWKLIGYDDSLNHKPPFGYYDAQPQPRVRKEKHDETVSDIQLKSTSSSSVREPAGGIMAKQLSVAGFSVVVLEQGGWGKYGREHEYNKDEWLNRNLSDEDRLMSDPSRQRNTFRPNDKVKSRSRHPQLRLRSGRRHGHVRRQQLAAPAV